MRLSAENIIRAVDGEDAKTSCMQVNTMYPSHEIRGDEKTDVLETVAKSQD